MLVGTAGAFQFPCLCTIQTPHGHFKQWLDWSFARHFTFAKQEGALCLDDNILVSQSGDFFNRSSVIER